jgi:hypothetical protein
MKTKLLAIIILFFLLFNHIIGQGVLSLPRVVVSSSKTITVILFGESVISNEIHFDQAYEKYKFENKLLLASKDFLEYRSLSQDYWNKISSIILKQELDIDPTEQELASLEIERQQLIHAILDFYPRRSSIENGAVMQTTSGYLYIFPNGNKNRPCRLKRGCVKPNFIEFELICREKLINTSGKIRIIEWKNGYLEFDGSKIVNFYSQNKEDNEDKNDMIGCEFSQICFDDEGNLSITFSGLNTKAKLSTNKIFSIGAETGPISFLLDK